MRQRIWGRWGLALGCATPALARAATEAAPAWLAVLPDVLCGLAALALVGFGLWMLVLTLVGAEAGELSFRRHAGSFGGSSTGWQMSQALARLLAGLALILLALAVTMARLPLKDVARPEVKADAATPEAKAASASVSAAPAASAASAK
jgi:TRAP-type C4-dicarboxylate transport system permease small subunit